MSFSKILVTGGTGFIGTRLCERLSLHHRQAYRVIVRQFTHANRIARLGAELVGGDLARAESISAALEGCDAVIHLAHSSDEAAPAETRNLMEACATARVRRLVHVSSMSVHGERPGPECANEETAIIARRYDDPYCTSKARVEEIIADGARKHGISTAIVRPTIVYGPYSAFVMGIIADARAGIVSLIDDGRHPCNAVYVDDVCDAIWQGLHRDEALGKPCLLTSGEPITWKDFTLAFANMVTPAPEIVSLDSGQINAYWEARRPTFKSNAATAAKLALSPDLHKVLSRVPAFSAAIVGAKRFAIRNTSRETALKLKSKLRAPVARSGARGPAMPNRGRIIRETFPHVFSNMRARTVLDWQPRYDLAAGAAVTRQWLEYARMLSAPDLLLP
jgi:nucleoside-diphosphate-sugar epimerase